MENVKECGSGPVPGEKNRDMVAGTHPPVCPDGPFCPGFDVKEKVPGAEVPAGICLEEDRFVPALCTLHGSQVQ
jgi:hypothetical protein